MVRWRWARSHRGVDILQIRDFWIDSKLQAQGDDPSGNGVTGGAGGVAGGGYYGSGESGGRRSLTSFLFPTNENKPGKISPRGDAWRKDIADSLGLDPVTGKK